MAVKRICFFVWFKMLLIFCYGKPAFTPPKKTMHVAFAWITIHTSNNILVKVGT